MKPEFGFSVSVALAVVLILITSSDISYSTTVVTRYKKNVTGNIECHKLEAIGNVSSVFHCSIICSNFQQDGSKKCEALIFHR